MKYILNILQAEKDTINGGLRFCQRKLNETKSEWEIDYYTNELQVLRANLSKIDKAIKILNNENKVLKSKGINTDET